MPALVGAEGAREGKACIATRNIARKRLFVGMDALVGNQTAIQRKACVTAREVEFERPLSRMGPRISHQVTWPVETFAASWVVTYVLLFLCCLRYNRLQMRAHVNPQVM